MKSFELLAHTADVRILAKGDTPDNLFSASLEGLCRIIKPGYENKVSAFNLKKKIEVESIDITTLLVDFLSDALTLMHEEKALFPKVEIKKITTNYIECLVYGFKVRGFSEDVKAVTYHEADVTKNENGIYETIIVLDFGPVRVNVEFVF